MIIDEPNLAALDESIRRIEIIAADESLSPEGFASRVRYWTNRLDEAVSGDWLDLDRLSSSVRTLQLEFRDAGPESRASAMAEAREHLNVIRTLLPGLARNQNQKLYELGLSERAHLSRRTRSAIRLALLPLPCADRERYSQEYASELAELPRAEQAPYAIRQALRAWWLRRSLKGKSGVGSGSVVVVVAAGAGGGVCLAAMSWPAAVLGGLAVIAVMWTVSNPDRTRRLATLIRAARGGSAPTRKK